VRSREITARQKVAVWATALLAVSVITHGYSIWTSGLLDRAGHLKASDYMRLYVTGSLASQGRWSELFDANAHVREAQRRIDPRVQMEGLRPNYGPTAAIMLGPLSRLEVLRSWTLFSFVSVAVFLLSARTLAARCQALAASTPLVVLVCAATPALFITLRYGQLSAITTALFAAAVTLDRSGRPILAGFCLGMAAYKPHLVIPAGIVWLASQRWRLLAGLILGVGLHLAVGLVAAGPNVTVEWFRTLLALAQDPNQVQGFPHEVHSLRGFWRLLGATPPGLSWLTAVSTVIVLLGTIWIWRARATSEYHWAALVTASVLVAPHLLTYDLLLMTIPLILISAVSLGARVQPRGLKWLAAGIYFAPLVSPTIAGLVGIQISTLLSAGLLSAIWRYVTVVDAGSSSRPSISS
jgi:alpha-1,2-mannosyltransferase